MTKPGQSRPEAPPESANETTPTLDRSTGLPAHIRHAITWTLTDAGFPRPDAEAWANGWAMTPEPHLAAHHATAYDDHGIPTALAIQWHQHGFLAHDACTLNDAGWTPAQASIAYVLAWDTDTELDDWAATSLPPDRVIAYLCAGVRLSEVATFESLAINADEVLGWMAALLDSRPDRA